jgi:hypothetical protein
MQHESWLKVEVKLDYGSLRPTLLWANSHIVGRWSYEVLEEAGNEAGTYRFYFLDSRDALTFSLKTK